MCGLMTTKKGCSSSLIAELGTLWYIGFQQFFFVSYYFFFEIDDFFFQDTYNTQLKEIYDDNLSTHPDLDPDL
jgi:hypothetical protein